MTESQVCVLQASNTRVMLGGRLVGQFSTDELEEEVRRESHMAPSLLQGVWTSCRAVPCQEMGGRKEEREGQEHRQVRERWSVVVPEEEARMTQATGLCNQKGRERQRQREERGRGRHTGDRGEREHTHFCNLIRESSRLLPSASKGYGHVYTHTHTQI